MKTIITHRGATVTICLLSLLASGCSTNMLQKINNYAAKDNLQNVATDTEYIHSDPEGGITSSSGEAETNLKHAGDRFILAIKNAQKYKSPPEFPIFFSKEYVKEQIKILDNEIKNIEQKVPKQKSDLEQLTNLKKENKSVTSSLDYYEYNLGLEKLLQDKNSSNNYLAQHLSFDRYSALYEFVQSGFSFSDLNCKQFFNVATHRQNQRSFLYKEAELASGLTAALMGIFGASAQAISATAASFSFAQSSGSVLESTLAITADIYTLLPIVENIRKQEYEKTFPPLGPSMIGISITTYYDAEKLIANYAQPCTITGLKQIVADAVHEKAMKK
ncbi:MAG: hypothetical protein ACRCU9_05095 [Iodobacter sp.]